jgi:hypothetical protein
VTKLTSALRSCNSTEVEESEAAVSSVLGGLLMLQETVPMLLATLLML